MSILKFKTMEIYNYNKKIGASFGSIVKVNNNTQYEYRIGKYVSKEGYVDIYAENKYVCLSFYYSKRIFYRNISGIKTPLTDNQIIRMAGKFSREIINNHLKN